MNLENLFIENHSSNNLNESLDTKLHPVQKYFYYSKETHLSLCLHCNKKYKTRHSSNLLRHIAAKHKEIHETIRSEVADFFQKRKEEKDLSKNKPTTPTIINVKYDLDYLTKSCVALCTLDGRPYGIFDDVGMSGFLQPIYEACDRAGINFRINRENIHKHCDAYQTKLRNILREEIRNKLVSLQTDIVSILDR